MDRVSFAFGLSDGRSLEVDISGPDGATPLVVHHGTPGERSQYPPFADAAAAQGLRYVSYSRPGYGGSSRQPGRAVADCAADTAAILAHLGADRCYTIGAFGGGPHALACAALLGRPNARLHHRGRGRTVRRSGSGLPRGMGREIHEEFGGGAGRPGGAPGLP
jgi:pimeloyl-ACP methyl ester carboxylesterase